MHSSRPLWLTACDSNEVRLLNIFLLGSSIHRIIERLSARICKVLFNSYFSFANEMTALAEFKAMKMDAGTSSSLLRAVDVPCAWRF